MHKPLGGSLLLTLGLSLMLVSASGSSFRVCLHLAPNEGLPHPRALPASDAHAYSLGLGTGEFTPAQGVDQA